MVCESYEDLKHAATCKLGNRQYLPNQSTAILSLSLCYRDEHRKKKTQKETVTEQLGRLLDAISK